MPVVKLNSSHKVACRGLFKSDKYMGKKINDTPSFQVYMNANDPNIDPASVFNNRLYNIFCSNYLSGLNNFHAFGFEEDGEIKASISFYESPEEPAWYYTLYRSTGDNNLLKQVLDEVIKYNEGNGRLKFYTLVHQKQSKLLRRFHWNKENNERYGYFDEFLVPGKTKCFYTNHWELLFKRFLVPDDSVVRCNFVKQEYRTQLPIGGGV
jgi:hypothetical protein